MNKTVFLFCLASMVLLSCQPEAPDPIEQLLSAEQMGWLCRDSTIEGVRYFPNLFRGAAAGCNCLDGMPILDRGQWSSPLMKAGESVEDGRNSLLTGDMTRSDNCGVAVPVIEEEISSPRHRRRNQQQGFNSMMNSFSEMARSTTDNIQNFWNRRRRTV